MTQVVIIGGSTGYTEPSYCTAQANEYATKNGLRIISATHSSAPGMSERARRNMEHVHWLTVVYESEK